MMHQRTHVPLTSRLNPKKKNLYANRRNNNNDDNSKYKKGSFPKSIILMSLIAVLLIACGEYTYFHSTQQKVKSNKSNAATNIRKTSEIITHVEQEFELSDKDKAILKLEKDDYDDDDETEKVVAEDYEEYEKEERNEEVADEKDIGEGKEDDTTTTKDPTYHIIFSTDCSDYQHWQSYLLFYSAYKIKQKGYVTRIASGCSDAEQNEEQAWHDKHIQNSLNSKFKIHFTPKFSTVLNGDETTGKDYKFFNKPFGLRHWMENGEGMGLLPGSTKLKNEDDIVMLLDPDMILLRPLSHDFTHTDELTIKKTIHPIDDAQKQDHWIVKHGQPFAALYGYGIQWQSKIDLEIVTGDANTNAKKVNANDARQFYPMGPPYLATAKDMYEIAIKWTEFAPGVHKQYPYLLAEMFAYSISAAHLNLPHQPIESLMISATHIGIEGWKWIDDIPLDNVCSYDSSTTNLPYVFHYCQRYIIKDILFAKRKPKLHKFFTCESPLFKEVDFDDVKHLDYKMKQENTGVIEEKISPQIAKREIFSVCYILSLMNEASTFFKNNHCSDKANYDKLLTLWE